MGFNSYIDFFMGFFFEIGSSSKDFEGWVRYIFKMAMKMWLLVAFWMNRLIFIEMHKETFRGVTIQVLCISEPQTPGCSDMSSDLILTLPTVTSFRVLSSPEKRWFYHLQRFLDFNLAHFLLRRGRETEGRAVSIAEVHVFSALGPDLKVSSFKWGQD